MAEQEHCNDDASSFSNSRTPPRQSRSAAANAKDAVASDRDDRVEETKTGGASGSLNWMNLFFGCDVHDEVDGDDRKDDASSSSDDDDSHDHSGEVVGFKAKDDDDSHDHSGEVVGFKAKDENIVPNPATIGSRDDAVPLKKTGRSKLPTRIIPKSSSQKFSTSELAGWLDNLITDVTDPNETKQHASEEIEGLDRRPVNVTGNRIGGEVEEDVSPRRAGGPKVPARKLAGWLDDQKSETSDPVGEPMRVSGMSQGHNSESSGHRIHRGNRNNTTMSFLASIPIFANLRRDQLRQLELAHNLQEFETGEVVFKQGALGKLFYVVEWGSLEVLLRRPGDEEDSLGHVVTTLGEGDYFGERALMMEERRAATIRASDKTQCMVYSKHVFERVLSGVDSLMDNPTVDLSSMPAAQTLTQHVQRFQEAVNSNMEEETDNPAKQLLIALTNAFSPELNLDDVMERMACVAKDQLRADRFGLFIYDGNAHELVQQVSESQKGVRMPVAGIAGHVFETAEPINISDCHEHEAFNAHTDEQTGYRTKQVMAWPIVHPSTGYSAGVVQLTNRTDNEVAPFSESDMHIFGIAASFIGEVLEQRDDEASILMEADPSKLHFIALQSLDDSISISAGRVKLSRRAESAAGEKKAKAIASPEKSLRRGDNGTGNNSPTVTPTKINPRHNFYVRMALFHGDQPLCEHQRSAKAKIQINPHEKNVSEVVWSDSVDLGMKTSNLPKAARVMFEVRSHGKGVGWAGLQVFDFQGHMVSGNVELKLWPGECPGPNMTALQNTHDPRADILEVNFAEREHPVVFMDAVYGKDFSAAQRSSEVLLRNDNLLKEQPVAAERIIKMSLNPFESMTAEGKADMWNFRFGLLNDAAHLPQFLRSVNWGDAEQVATAQGLLAMWSKPTTAQALQLLDCQFPDAKVRSYAVHCLESIDDEELALYMLYFCQQLKYEPYHDSSLARFLLRRSLLNRRIIGHTFFWFLKAEMHTENIRDRYGVLLQLYLHNCGDHRLELGRQMFVMRKLEQMASIVKTKATKSERLNSLHDELEKTVFPDLFQLPLNPHIYVTGIILEECHVMESKKKPLWLVFETADEVAPPVTLMFKAGNDLRQDQLTLQMIKVMDKLWKDRGLDLEMGTYGCISTGKDFGMIEVVEDATTLASITSSMSEKRKTIMPGLRHTMRAARHAATHSGDIAQWMENQAIDKAAADVARTSDLSDTLNASARLSVLHHDRAKSRFALSCAGCCVATHVLGIGDRHSDNIMLTTSGTLFHIDFGHFLGHFKKKFGVLRERSPFVFTPSMAKVLGTPESAHFQLFQTQACTAYNILRQNSLLLTTLLSLMLPSGIPELQTAGDIRYVNDSLCTGYSDTQAAEHFRSLIIRCMKTKSTQMNDVAHMLKHY